MQDMQQKPQVQSAIEIQSFDELRELINEIPEGTIYSVDLGEVILTNGQKEE